MNALLLSLSLAAALATGQYAPQRAGSDPLPPEQEARVQKLGKELRCAVCQGMSVADSPSSMARAQLDRVRELVAEGKSDQEIRDYFVARYGEWVLLTPKAEGFNWVVWLGPGVLLVGGAWVILRQLRGGPAAQAPAAQKTEQTPGATEATEAKPAATEPEDPYLQAVRRELDP